MTPQADRAAAGIHCLGVMHLYPGEATPVVALRSVDLDVEEGELLAVLGPSGSGKSTLLSLLSGLLRPTAGTVRVAGHDFGALDATALTRLRGTELALVLQDPSDNVLPYATPAQNVRFAQRGARRYGWPLQWSPDDLLEGLGLAGLGDRPLHELSAGEQQQVALAAALAVSPRVVLADEPTAHLDPEGRNGVIAGLQRVNELSHATTVIVTHDPVVAGAMARTVTIDNGHVQSESRGGHQYAIVGRDGVVSLPADMAEEFPPGTLLSVRRTADGIELRHEGDNE